MEQEILLEAIKELSKPPFINLQCPNKDYKIFGFQFGIRRDLFSNASGLAKAHAFILAAMNQKWERENSEPLRWIPKVKDMGGWKFKYNECPSCGFGGENKDNYCPYCGQKLDPPEGEKQ
jgi:hypothetical protein